MRNASRSSLAVQYTQAPEKDLKRDIQMENVAERNFYLTQTEGSFRNEIGEMSEMDVYAHVRTRLGDDAVAAEDALRELGRTGAATVQFNNSLGKKSRMDIRRIGPPSNEMDE